MKWNRRSRRWSIVTLLVVGIVAGTALFHSRPPSYPSVMILDNLQTLPSVPPTLMERFLGLIPPTWGWFWRPKEAIFGTPTRVNIDVCFINTGGLLPGDLGDFALQEPTYTNANGSLRVWIADEMDLKKLQKTFARQERILSRPRVSTAHEVESSLWVGAGSALVNGKKEDVGVWAEFLPRVHGNAVDLLSLLQSTELLANRAGDFRENVSVRTNIALASRFQIPQSKGVFLMDEGTSKHGAYGIIVLTSFPASKK